jgi:hypothetical protein
MLADRGASAIDDEQPPDEVSLFCIERFYLNFEYVVL